MPSALRRRRRDLGPGALLALAALAAGTLGSAGAAAADPPPAPAPGDTAPVAAAPQPHARPRSAVGPVDDRAFRYTTPADTDLGRAVGEQLIILSIGYIQYATNKANEADWDVGTNWDGVRSKLTLSASSFDDNRFPTNWLTHPFAGYWYYTAARSNRLPILPSLTIAAASATMWEMFGELREHVAINDIIATPATALPLGESLLQLGAFFQRGRRTAPVTALGWMLAPLKSTHDAIDGLRPLEASVVDDLGLPADVWHRFAVGGSSGLTWQEGARSQLDLRGYVKTELVTLPGYRRAWTGSQWFGSGEVSSIKIAAAGAENRFVDMFIGASALPVGWHWQDVRASAGGGLRGTSFLAGLHTAAEYATHDYDRDDRRGPDRVGLAAAGVTLEQMVFADAVTLRARLDVLANFAGVDAYALPEYHARFGDAGLTSVLAKQRYHHAYGATVRPTLELTIGRVDAGADARFDAFESIEGVDVEGPVPGGEVGVTDRRAAGRVWLGITPARHVRVYLTGERNERWGRMADVRASRSEVGMYLGTEVVF